MFNIINSNVFKSNVINNINFMGAKKTAPAGTPTVTKTAPAQDMFTFSSKTTADEISAKLQNAQEELKEAKAAFPSLEAEYKKTAAEYRAALNELNHADEFERKEKECAYKPLQKVYNKTKKEYTALKSKIKTLEKYIADLEVYKKQNEIHPKTAFMYDPDTRAYDISCKISQTPGLYESRNLASNYGVDTSIFDNFIKEGYLTADKIGSLQGSFQSLYIDTEYPQNEEFLTQLEEKLPTSLSAGQFNFNFNFTQAQLDRMGRNGEIKPLFTKRHTGLNFLIDIKDPTNAKTIEEHIKTTPIPSKKHYTSAMSIGSPASVVYLSKLGFGTPMQLAQLVKNGTLKGSSKQLENKKYLVTVDVNSLDNERTLMELRSKNPNTLTSKDFIKRTGIKQSEFKELLLSGEIEIIPEYVFEFDHSQVFVDLNNPKNQEFVDKKLIEKEIQDELTAKRRKENGTTQRLIMKLAWHFSPNMKQASKKQAAIHPEVMQIFEKIEQEGKNSLTDEEDKTLKCFYKGIWNTIGTEEFNEARQKAKEIVSKYKEGRTDEISSGELTIIEEYLANKEAA